MLGRRVAIVFRCIAGVPRHPVANATQAAVARGDQRLEYGFYFCAKPQVRMTDDACEHACFPIAAPGARRRNAVDEFDLTDRLLRVGTVGAIRQTRLDEYGRDDIVAAAIDVF